MNHRLRLRHAAFSVLLLASGALPIRAAAVLLEDPGARCLRPGEAPVSVHGLGWYQEDKPALTRLPLRLKATFPPKVWSLAQSPAGVRLRFATDAAIIGVVAKGSGAPPAPHMTAIATGGIDLYVDGSYRGSAAPDSTGKLRAEWPVGKARARREITIYLPYGRGLALEEIRLEAGAQAWPARAFAVAKPVVYYGSSITQGIAAANPGGTFPALLGRWLDTDFVNLGFSGNGLGEPALARAMAEIDAACYVVDYWANPTTEIYRTTLPAFIAILRAAHPDTPILVTGPYFNPSEDVPGDAGERQVAKRAFAREFVAHCRAAGDRRIEHVDGLEMLPREFADGLVDSRHANSMGFYLCAKGLEPALRAALGLKR